MLFLAKSIFFSWQFQEGAAMKGKKAARVQAAEKDCSSYWKRVAVLPFFEGCGCFFPVLQ